MNVSAIIPVRDGVRYLGEAIGSVQAQTRRADELVVVDDGSTDGSAELAEWLGARCLRQPARGVAAARNLGVREARGDLLAFLDADDLWTPDKLEVQLACMRDRRELLYTLAHFRHFQDGSPVDGVRRDVLEGVYPGWQPSLLVARREAFDVVGPFDESMPSAADVDWFARATDLAVPMAMLPELLLLKRAHADSLMWTSGHANLFRALRSSVARKRAPGGPA